MSNRNITRTAILAGIAIAVGVSAAAPASADPIDNYVADDGWVVCQSLAGNPTLHQIEVIGDAIVRDTGWSYTNAGSVIKESIMVDCPRWTALWNTFVDVYGDHTAAPAPSAPAPSQTVGVRV